VNEINEILANLVGLKQENESLKSVLKDKCRELSNLYKKRCHVTDYNVNVPTKPLYNSFFEKSESLDDHKVATIGKNERIDMIQSDESGIDKGIDKMITKHNLKNRNIRSYSPAVVSEIKKIRSQIKATDDMNKILTNSEIVAAEVSSWR
jgi:hypothetical protein